MTFFFKTSVMKIHVWNDSFQLERHRSEEHTAIHETKLVH